MVIIYVFYRSHLNNTHYSKTCLNGHLYLKDNLFIKNTLLSPILAFHA